MLCQINLIYSRFIFPSACKKPFFSPQAQPKNAETLMINCPENGFSINPGSVIVCAFIIRQFPDGRNINLFILWHA